MLSYPTIDFHIVVVFYWLYNFIVNTSAILQLYPWKSSAETLHLWTVCDITVGQKHLIISKSYRYKMQSKTEWLISLYLGQTGLNC